MMWLVPVVAVAAAASTTFYTAGEAAEKSGNASLKMSVLAAIVGATFIAYKVLK